MAAKADTLKLFSGPVLGREAHEGDRHHSNRCFLPRGWLDGLALPGQPKPHRPNVRIDRGHAVMRSRAIRRFVEFGVKTK